MAKLQILAATLRTGLVISTYEGVYCLVPYLYVRDVINWNRCIFHRNPLIEIRNPLIEIRESESGIHAWVGIYIMRQDPELTNQTLDQSPGNRNPMLSWIPLP